MDRDTRNILNLKQPNLFSYGEVSTDGMSDGQITISKGSNQQPSLSLKKDGIIYKTNMSSNGDQYVEKDLKVNGNLKVDGNIISKSVGIGTVSPENMLHIQDVAASAGVFFDTHSQLIVEDTDARLQIMSDYTGTNASALVLSNVNTVDDNVDSWFLHHNGVSAAGRFSIGYNSNQTANEDVVGSKTLSTDPFTILTSGHVGIGTASPTSSLHVDQSSTSGAVPVLKLDQADVDDSFIDFIGTTASDGSKSISSDTTEDSAKFGAIRVEINGVTKWIRIYDDQS